MDLKVVFWDYAYKPVKGYIINKLVNKLLFVAIQKFKYGMATLFYFLMGNSKGRRYSNRTFFK